MGYSFGTYFWCNMIIIPMALVLANILHQRPMYREKYSTTIRDARRSKRKIIAVEENAIRPKYRRKEPKDITCQKRYTQLDILKTVVSVHSESCIELRNKHTLRPG